MFISLERPRVLKKCSQNGDRVGYYLLKSNISNWLTIAYLKTKVDYVILHNLALPKFNTHDWSWCSGHDGKMYAHGDFFYFCNLIHYFSPFSLFPSLFVRLFLRISYAGSFELRLIGVDGAALRRYKDKPDSFGPKILIFLLFWKKCKRKVQGVPQSQTAALPRPQEEEETDKSKQAQTEQTSEKH